MLKNVQIQWDHPAEQQWLADDNITYCLQKECKNTHFITKELDLNQLCIEAAIEMQHANISRHLQFVNWQDADTGADNERLRCGWHPEKLMKVTIEWVDENEADPKNFEAV